MGVVRCLLGVALLGSWGCTFERGNIPEFCSDGDGDGLGNGLFDNRMCPIPDVDTDDTDPWVCSDSDNDGCDDCTDRDGNPKPWGTSDDGLDDDGDGICNVGDTDRDGDSVEDMFDPDPTTGQICGDSDADRCDDCASTWGPPDPDFDGADADFDGVCDVSDDCSDADGDGAGLSRLARTGCTLSFGDSDDTDPTVCADTDADGCDDCSSGTYDPFADGPDADGDGTCDATDCGSGPNQSLSEPEMVGTPACVDMIDNDCDGLQDNADPDCWWWDGNWGQRIHLEVDTSSLSAPLYDVPIPVFLNSDRLNYDRTMDDGRSVRFIAGDRVTVLAHEIEQWRKPADDPVVIEAEDFDTMVSVTGQHWWQVDPGFWGFSGDGVIRAVPEDSTNCRGQITACGARVTYTVEILQTGTYYFHVRYNSPDGLSNSLTWGMDGGIAEDLHTDPPNNAWSYWLWQTSPVTLTLGAGTHTLSVWMREDGQQIDQFVLSQTDEPPPMYARNGTSVAWVRLPTLDPGAGPVELWMYYGNSNATVPGNGSNVWDNGYAGVWHGTGTTAGGGALHESTGGNNDAQAINVDPPGSEIPGAVGPGVQLDGFDDYFEVCNDNCPSPLRLSGDGFTLEAWVAPKFDGIDTDSGIIDKHDLGNDERFYLGITDTGGWVDELACRVTVQPGLAADQQRMNAGQVWGNFWHYLVCRYDGGAGLLEGYVDAVKVGEVAATGLLADTSGDDLIFGRRYDQRYTAGAIDELRVSYALRSDDYIALQHRAMMDQLITYGSR